MVASFALCNVTIEGPCFLSACALKVLNLHDSKNGNMADSPSEVVLFLFLILCFVGLMTSGGLNLIPVFFIRKVAY